jgi:acetyl-CoA C-acetyltransferase
MSNTTPPDRIPVIIGAGEIIDRPVDPAQALEPLALMAEAARRAATDAGGGFLSQVDSIDIVGLVSWRYRDLPGLLNATLGLSPARSVYGPVGGESPVRYLHEAARRIASGTSEIGLVLGAEAQHAVNQAKKNGVSLPWTPYAADAPRFQRASDYVHPLAVKLGAFMPVGVYPLYDAATAAHWGQTPAEALAESGALWQRFSTIAADNPFSWSREAVSADAITRHKRDNRLIAWPYTKRMVANPNVNQGAAILVTSLAKARAAGIADDRLIFIGTGASASEPRDWLARDAYTASHAQSAVLEAMLTEAGGDASRFAELELYSCFPCVPKMARRTLGLGPDLNPTVTGGLSFFGAPLNNYMTHAACAMVRALRERDEPSAGLLYGQGEFVTKHHALMLAREPTGQAALGEARAQETADLRRGRVPPTETAPDGAARLETFTILYDPAGEPMHAVVVAMLDSGTRTLARIPAASADEMALLTSPDRYPIGNRGRISPAADGLPEWHTLGAA